MHGYPNPLPFPDGDDPGAFLQWALAQGAGPAERDAPVSAGRIPEGGAPRLEPPRRRKSGRVGGDAHQDRDLRPTRPCFRGTEPCDGFSPGL